MAAPISTDLSDHHEADYQRMASAIVYLQAQYPDQPDLGAIAHHLGLSEHHTQRLFSRWAGISPKRFQQYLTKEHAKTLLRQRRSVLDTAFAVGLSGSSRLHDLMITTVAMTPGEYASAAQGMTIVHGDASTPFGQCLMAITDRGLCKLDFFDTAQQRETLVQALYDEWPLARHVADQAQVLPWARLVFDRLDKPPTQPLHLLLKGSQFQLQVWQALLKLPSGCVATYGDVANALGKPKAQRAVGHAIGMNPIGFLIPCHRVIRQTGDIHHYRWGTVRKQAMLAKEAVQADTR